MADTKISAMTPAAALTGAELVPLVQSGVNVKSTVSALSTFTRTSLGNAGAFSSGVTQTGSTTVGTAFTYNASDYLGGVTLVSGSRLTVPVAGTYNIQFSTQLQTTDNAPQDVYIWLRVNGVDVAGSAGVIGLPARKNPTDPFHGIYGWNFFLTLTAGQYVEIVWLPTATTVTVPFYAAQTVPAIPSTQSVVATVQQIA
jgi:hypothetical protein